MLSRRPTTYKNPSSSEIRVRLCGIVDGKTRQGADLKQRQLPEVRHSSVKIDNRSRASSEDNRAVAANQFHGCLVPRKKERTRSQTVTTGFQNGN